MAPPYATHTAVPKCPPGRKYQIYPHSATSHRSSFIANFSTFRNRSYTWLNKNQEPVELPAHEYMTLMQRWISGKTDDVNIFPTDPLGVAYYINPEFSSTGGATARDAAGNRVIQGSDAGEWLGSRSGFPQQFGPTVQLIFRQIFRVYAHLYWNHYTEPFYHLNLEKQLNSCFSHFLLTAIALDMLTKEESSRCRS